MDAYIYKADIWCEQCGEAIREQLTKEGKAPEDPSDETSYDSDEFPKGPFPDGGGESDRPEHCAAGKDCLNALDLDGFTCGAFLENDLTTDGIRYLEEQLEDPGHGPVVEMWVEFYSHSYDLSYTRCPHCNKLHSL